jgi:hypothetical protein
MKRLRPGGHPDNPDDWQEFRLSRPWDWEASPSSVSEETPLPTVTISGAGAPFAPVLIRVADNFPMWVELTTGPALDAAARAALISHVGQWLQQLTEQQGERG